MKAAKIHTVKYFMKKKEKKKKVGLKFCRQALISILSEL